MPSTALTAEHIVNAFDVMSRAGLRHDYADATELRRSAEVWSVILSDVSAEDFTAAMLAYLRKPLQPGQYSRPWPIPAQLLDLTPKRQVLAVIDGGDLFDRTMAWHQRNASAAYHQPRMEPALGDVTWEEAEQEAVLAGLRAVGGVPGVRMSQTQERTWLRKTFAQAAETRIAHGRLTGELRASARALSTRGGGFRQIGQS